MNRVSLYNALVLAIGGSFFSDCRDVLMARKWLHQSAGFDGGLMFKAAGELLKAVAAYWEIPGGKTATWREQFGDLIGLLEGSPAFSQKAEVVRAIVNKDEIFSDDVIQLLTILSGLTFNLGMAVRQRTMDIRAETFGLRS